MSPENDRRQDRGPEFRQGPEFRDLYELQEKINARLEKAADRLGRVEKAVIVLAVVAASPKLGGPDAAKLVAQVIGLGVA